MRYTSQSIWVQEKKNLYCFSVPTFGDIEHNSKSVGKEVEEEGDQWKREDKFRWPGDRPGEINRDNWCVQTVELKKKKKKVSVLISESFSLLESR